MTPRRRQTKPPSPRLPSPRPTGADGERLAAEHLVSQGFRIEGYNVRTIHGEIDLLVRHRRLWIAVEVKTRAHHPAPERTVSSAQLERLRHSLTNLAGRLTPRPKVLRIDIIAVRTQPSLEVRHFPGHSWSWRPRPE